ncbi:hypothetical protein Syun_021159 [Stephania yunnanensis]|uniref:DNA-3-methyladenine glycosylase I n=1 Tax=Stephania yunnanensis TaxID=152371 RepID=A0AAP0IH48_9MAGN
MSKPNARKPKPGLVKSPSARDYQREKTGQSFISKHLKKIYPLGINRTSSSQSLSSLSSNDSAQNFSLTRMEKNTSKTKSATTTVPMPCRLKPQERREKLNVGEQGIGDNNSERGDGLKRCHWITKTSDEVYVAFHDMQWGVPVFEDNQLFELLVLSGMLIYHLWTEILKRREQYREAFLKFDPSGVAKMNEKDIKDIIGNKSLALAENQVRSIVDNAKCTLQIVKEFGSFGRYIWGYMNYKPVINRYRYPKSVPLRSPKAEAISKDLLRRGFRFVGPVIVLSFMQAAGMTMDHLVDCFRFSECASLSDFD